MTGLKARRLRHRVSVEQYVETQDPNTGAMVRTWMPYGDRWAEYVANSVREFISAASQQSEVKGRFLLREDSGITAQMRIVHRGKNYEILGVMPDPDSGLEYITCPVSEGVVCS